MACSPDSSDSNGNPPKQADLKGFSERKTLDLLRNLYFTLIVLEWRWKNTVIAVCNYILHIIKIILANMCYDVFFLGGESLDEDLKVANYW